jgi:hypothetical protein
MASEADSEKDSGLDLEKDSETDSSLSSCARSVPLLSLPRTSQARTTPSSNSKPALQG